MKDMPLRGVYLYLYSPVGSIIALGSNRWSRLLLKVGGGRIQKTPPDWSRERGGRPNGLVARTGSMPSGPQL